MPPYDPERDLLSDSPHPTENLAGWPPRPIRADNADFAAPTWSSGEASLPVGWTDHPPVHNPDGWTWDPQLERWSTPRRPHASQDPLFLSLSQASDRFYDSISNRAANRAVAEVTARREAQKLAEALGTGNFLSVSDNPPQPPPVMVDDQPVPQSMSPWMQNPAPAGAQIGEASAIEMDDSGGPPVMPQPVTARPKRQIFVRPDNAPPWPGNNETPPQPTPIQPTDLYGRLTDPRSQEASGPSTDWADSAAAAAAPQALGAAALPEQSMIAALQQPGLANAAAQPVGQHESTEMLKKLLGGLTSLLPAAVMPILQATMSGKGQVPLRYY